MANLSHLSDLQRAELVVFKEFIKICDKHNITYYITGGTLLGSIRHNGFIPWDDDIDIAMTRKEYNRFVEVANELPETMYLSQLDTPGHVWLVPRIIDKNTSFFLNNPTEKKQIGAWMDILIIDGVPNPGTLKFKWFGVKYLFARMLYQFSNFSTAVNMNKKRPWHESLAIKFAKFTHIEKILNPIRCGRFYDRICRQYDLDKCEYGAPLSGAMQLREAVDKSWFGQGKKYPFEDITVTGVDEADKYLTYIYGDYMTPPPMSDRNQHNVTKATE